MDDVTEIPSDVHFRLGNLTRADGSAVAASGNSAIQVAVHGPGEVPPHKELLEEAAVEVLFKSADRSKDVTADDKELQSFVRGVIQSVVRVELYPKTLIQVVVQELESDGPFLSLALNCICAALLDAGLALRATFAAATIAAHESDLLLVNPTSESLSRSCTLLTPVFESIRGDLLAVHQEGRPLSRDQLHCCLTVGARACRDLFRSLESAVTPASLQ